MVVDLLKRIRRYWMKLCLQPLRVFCLHHVCELYEIDVMNPCDWMAFSEFKEKIHGLHNQGYRFISLTDAYNRLAKDLLRRKKYAVLTFDDGYKSLLKVLPWLEEQNIPVTLFINGKYLDGISYRENPREQYLTYDELFNHTSPLIEIGHHGWEHTKVTEMTNAEFIDSLEKNIELLSKHPRYIPFWAYTWGVNNEMTNQILIGKNITPVLINGAENYNSNTLINRELLK